MSKAEFETKLREIASAIEGLTIDDGLAARLNEEFPAGGQAFKAIEALCHKGVAEGWLCENEHGGVHYSRPVNASPENAGFSVDIVRMKDLQGPYHAHPNGEIDMVMPIDADAKFCGHGAGWCAYAPGSQHYPTVSGGEALVLYLLPEGAIDFKAKPPA
ncbi:MAG: 4-hydroxylaminobenzoate lyase [Alphaproteobacteria bacterium]